MDKEKMEKKLHKGKVKKVVYVGNGADGQRYEEVMKENHIRNYYVDEGTGRNRYMVVQYLSRWKNKQKAYNGFVHNSAVFTGFFARKREKNGWHWLTKDGAWKRYIPNKKKYVVKHEEKIDTLFDEDTKEIVLQAVWMDEKGIDYIDCGYNFFQYPLMVHALGSVDGKTYCNSLEAFKNSVECGYKVFETDVHMTGDEKIVLYHNRIADNEIAHMNYNELKEKMPDNQTMLTAGDLYNIMKEHPEFYIELDLFDFKGEAIKKRISLLLEEFNYDKDVLDRLLIQAFDMKMLKDIDSVYKFKNYQIMVGAATPVKYDRLIAEYLQLGVAAISLRTSMAKKEYVDKFRKSGIYILGYTVDTDLAVTRRLLDFGVNTLCTNHVTPDMLPDAVDTFGHNPFKVYYNSGRADVHESYSEELDLKKEKCKVKVMKSGNVEVQFSEPWENDGQRKLEKNRFSVEGEHFAGWQIRVSVDGAQWWLCTDNCYRLKNLVSDKTPYTFQLFEDEALIPEWVVPENATYVMVAAWTKDIS